MEHQSAPNLIPEKETEVFNQLKKTVSEDRHYNLEELQDLEAKNTFSFAPEKRAMLTQFKSSVKRPYDTSALNAINDKTDNAFVLNIGNRETWSRDEKKHLENHVVSKAAAKRDKELHKTMSLRPR